MLMAWLGALSPVALGLALAQITGASGAWVRPIRLMAGVAALGVVGFVLLPSAVAALGLGAIGLFLLAAVAPIGLERLAAGTRRSEVAETVGVELGFLALALHQAVDGIQIGAAWRVEDPGAMGITVAIGLHAIPLVAGLQQGILEREGPRAGWIHAALLLVATGVGVALGSMGAEAFPSIEGWLPAVAGGRLVPVLGHDLLRRRHHHAA